ncbi:Uncharacterized protein OBRU01_11321, partial [Operophtera brumata]
MDQSYSDSDISVSPSQLLERLQMLRQLQLLQRGKLQKQRLEYRETSENYETSSCITEIISHFSNSNNSTSYNTFQSLLQSPQSTEPTRLNTSEIAQKVNDRDLIDGISVLNLSQESEFIENSPASTNRAPSNNEVIASDTILTKKQISLDEMPILSPRKDFEALVLEKLQMEKNMKAKSPQSRDTFNNKKQYLKRGEGMARFGVKRNYPVIQNTKSLPWRRKNLATKPVQSLEVKNYKKTEKLDMEVLLTDPKLSLKSRTEPKPTADKVMNEQLSNNDCRKTRTETNNSKEMSIEPETRNYENKVPDVIIQMPKGKHPMLATKGKTWAAVLSKEQSDFLSKLKQSDYYKNFASPAKSTVSDISCDENASELRPGKETAEQNLFDLLENKVTRESFNLENSFFSRFLRSNLECSGESTPLIMQKCLADNPNLMHIFPNMNRRQKNSYNETEHEAECCSDTCSSVSSCCSCNTVEPATPQDCNRNKKVDARKKKEVSNEIDDTKHQSVIDKETEVMKANMAEMNAKLLTTSELLKERLRELEDEIETFRKENVNLNKLREDVDMERQKFYEEKNSFEQKFNEEKILSEYYLADEKEKLNKQKQMYERYVREMRGRLNKKEKDEVVNLKQEITNLKEEIRMKDAKSTSTIARLRNQIKIMEKEKNDFHTEVEKLKKENRRIQHSNDITRRLTNMKYLEQINKKLSNMNKETRSEVELSADTKYKAFEIERQSRSRKVQAANMNTIRPRAKSVPNLKVTSRYAKYFSQKDAVSERNNTMNIEKLESDSDTEILDNDINTDDDESNEINTENEENNLEKIYMETFRSNSPRQSNMRKSNGCYNTGDTLNNTNGFFLRKSNSTSSRDSKSPSLSISQTSLNRSKSPVSAVSHRPSNLSSHTMGTNSHRSKSPTVLSNHSSLRSGTVIPNDAYTDMLMSVSPEPSSSKTSLTKTSLNPTEIRKSDGSRELRFPNGNVKCISADGKYSKFVYYNGDVKENFLSDGRIKYFYAETKTYHTTHADGLEVLEFPEEEWRFPDGAALTVSASGEQRIAFSNGQIEVHAKDHK